MKPAFLLSCAAASACLVAVSDADAQTFSLLLDPATGEVVLEGDAPVTGVEVASTAGLFDVTQLNAAPDIFGGNVLAPGELDLPLLSETDSLISGLSFVPGLAPVGSVSLGNIVDLSDAADLALIVGGTPIEAVLDDVVGSVTLNDSSLVPLTLSLIPEPATASLAFVGMATLLVRRR
jgi:hypothetical protein